MEMWLADNGQPTNIGLSSLPSCGPESLPQADHGPYSLSLSSEPGRNHSVFKPSLCCFLHLEESPPLPLTPISVQPNPVCVQ